MAQSVSVQQPGVSLDSQTPVICGKSKSLISDLSQQFNRRFSFSAGCYYVSFCGMQNSSSLNMSDTIKHIRRRNRQSLPDLLTFGVILKVTLNYLEKRWTDPGLSSASRPVPGKSNETGSLCSLDSKLLSLSFQPSSPPAVLF